MQDSRFDALANVPFTQGFLSKDAITTLKDELVFERAVQSYLWALPALNMYGMKEGSERVFGKGYKQGNFSLYIRAYWPKVAVTDGSWTPPPVKRASQ